MRAKQHHFSDTKWTVTTDSDDVPPSQRETGEGGEAAAT